MMAKDSANNGHFFEKYVCTMVTNGGGFSPIAASVSKVILSYYHFIIKSNKAKILAILAKLSLFSTQIFKIDYLRNSKKEKNTESECVQRCNSTLKWHKP